MFVVAGVTGNTGAVVANTLIDAGKKVRVLVRDEKKGEAFRAKGADVRVIASLEDSAALAAAFEGASGAYLLSPPDLHADDFLADRRRMVDAMAEAIDKSKIAHVVFLSSVGAHKAGGTGPIRSVHYAEERLSKTAAKLTFVRAATFLENWGAFAGAAKGGKLPTFIPANTTYAMVASHDIGVVAARALLEGAPAKKIDVIELAGARDLNANDVAKILGEALGKPVVAEDVPLQAVVPTFTSFGLSKGISELYREMYEGVINGTVEFEGHAARFVRGTTDPATVLKAFVA